MLGSRNNFFRKSNRKLRAERVKVFKTLQLKGYKLSKINIYLHAFDYFCVHKDKFDGATIVKDLIDIPGLDLDAMLHDYLYVSYNAAANFKTKFWADWIYFKGMERKGKDNVAAFVRFFLLTITGVVYVPYTYLKKGKVTKWNSIQLKIYYNNLKF